MYLNEIAIHSSFIVACNMINAPNQKKPSYLEFRLGIIKYFANYIDIQECNVIDLSDSEEEHDIKRQDKIGKCVYCRSLKIYSNSCFISKQCKVYLP